MNAISRIILALFLAVSCSLQAQTVKVAAAADLRYALDEIVKSFKNSNKTAEIEVIYGSSGNAFTQISNGAPYDLYFSADILYPEKLKQAGLTLSEPKLYAIGQIVLWSASLDVSTGLSVLTEKPDIRIAIANPAHAPYGQRAVEALKFYTIFDKIEPQLIFGENISQAAQFCLSGNADAGLLALSLVLSPTMQNKGKYILINESSHRSLKQGYVILNHAKGNNNAFAFAEFINTKEARNILGRYGFTLPVQK
ncbi:MAG: molybdate ABC transporter substrate-binding protein [Prolixibacteraceae bacterium]